MPGTTPIDVIIQGDCLEEMKKLPDGCIDMILCDLPYGTTENHWDTIIPFHLLWEQYRRIAKKNTAMVFTAAQPFATDLINSARDMFRYDIVWHKTMPVGFFNSGKMPLRAHELVLVFYRGLPTYNPQGNHCKPGIRKRNASWAGHNYHNTPLTDTKNRGITTPTSVVVFSNNNNDNVGHGTQKPVALFEYLIKTYTNEGDLVLDNCIGSGTTAVAAKRTGRHFIGIELSPEYCEIARKRVAAVPARLDRWAEADA